MTPDELRRLLDEERTGRRSVIDLTVADLVDEDDDGKRLLGGLL